MNALALNQNPLMAFFNKHHRIIMRGLLVAAVAMFALFLYQHANAATSTDAGATDFDGIYKRIVAWTSGTLGKTVAIAAFIIGIALGAVKGSFIGGIAGGIVVAVAITQMPGLIEKIAGATELAHVGVQTLSGLAHAIPLM